ncbi:vanadium-dependent haloperoxidase [Ferruginibacter sp.]|uniref:vanadium-dependent haloperoxidase n=1 Tax=Ferruginibacter sp. TaxID=1940288 RepID=UPI001982ED24|nr:vanadium-dependent haloperoxidase [Ferruginibacter sp.]MBC7627604.1 vanadium-dependent haloperoxidase [Ferruginibacter sp.]
MKSYRFFILIFLLSASLKTVANDDWKKLCEDPEYLHRSVKEVTDVMVHDIYSPPVASRIYAYVNIAGYEAAHYQDKNYISFVGRLHGLSHLSKPVPGKEYCYALAGVSALLSVAKSMIISEEKIGNFYDAILKDFKATGIPDEVFNNSIVLGGKIAGDVITWSLQDNYQQTRSLSKYIVNNDAATWKPTPPAYMKAIEPHWGELRTFLIDTAQQFKPVPPTKFSTDTSSRFYKEARDVETIGSNLTAQQTEIANFWDCNPFKMNVNGHVMYATKKISPGGHWINITRLACKKRNADFMQSAKSYAYLSVVLADCFISCWDEKYRSKSIRPETYINKYISQRWVPLLQTPPFPEYTSGHSVVSAACAVLLTSLFGENFAYADSTEVEFQIPVRYFNSFNEAAKEAAISRFYGGIHYMPSITFGLEEGRKIGEFICQKLLVVKHEKALHSSAIK